MCSRFACRVSLGPNPGTASNVSYFVVAASLARLVCSLRALQVFLQLYSCIVNTFSVSCSISVLQDVLLSLALRLQRSLHFFSRRHLLVPVSSIASNLRTCLTDHKMCRTVLTSVPSPFFSVRILSARVYFVRIQPLCCLSLYSIPSGSCRRPTSP